MEKKNGLFEWLTNQISSDDDMTVDYNPNTNILFSSKMGDGKGNYNIFHLIYDPNEPELKQRIYDNDNRNIL